MRISDEAKIGIVVIVAGVILFAGLNFLRGYSLFMKDGVYYSYYDKVNGLKVSSPVEYRGYQVGQVSKISFMGDRADRVLVEFNLTKKLQLPKDTKAQIISQDLMNTKVINLVSGSSLEFLEEKDTLIGDIERDLKEQVSMQILPLKSRAENMLASLDSALVVIQYIFTEETMGNIKNSLSSVRSTLKNVESTSVSLDSIVKSEGSKLDNIFDNIEDISSNLRMNNENISNIFENVSSLSDSIIEANLGQSLRDIKEVAFSVNVITQKINAGKGSIGAILNDRDLYNNLNETSKNMNKLMLEVKNNPKRFVSFSLIDFTKDGKKSSYEYAIVVKSSDNKIARDNKLFELGYPLEECFYNGKYLYIYHRYKKLKPAKKILNSLKKEFPEVYIEKINIF